jgi:acyl-CoA synthetase (AMP-forming)/AMP-acid ligase II
VPLRPVTPALAEHYYATGAWQHRALHEIVDEIAERRPDALAVADQHDRLTYAELVARSHALARWLLEQDLPPGSAVVLQSANRVAIPVTHLACNRADLIFVPLSNAWRRSELEHLLGVSAAAVAIVPAPYKGFDFLATVAELRPQLPSLRAVGALDSAGGDFDFDEVCRRDVEPVRRPRDPNDPRFVMVTSGTTATPRMSLWTDNNLYFFMKHFRARVELSEQDIAVGLAPANTGATGYVFPVLGPMLSGASSVLLEDWEPAAALDLLEKEQATMATAIPTQVVKMLQDDSVRSRDFAPMRVFTNAGAPTPPETARELEEVFGCALHVCYGATDGGVPAMTTISDPPGKRHTSVGLPLPDTDLRLVDPALQDVPAGEPGELLWRSPTKTYGYFNEPERTEAMFIEDGWYRSGDVGRIDADGYLHIVGRVKDIIIRGGQNISPRELEDLIAGHPAVSEVAVIGVPDKVYGERACACVVTRAGRPLTLADLVAYLQEREVATFKLPERLELFDELPKSAGAKLNKVDLRVAVAAREQAAP